MWQAFFFNYKFSACISSALRLQSSIRVLRDSNNYTYHAFLTGIWTLPEATSAFAVACFPILPKFFRHLRDKLRRNNATTGRTSTLSSIVNIRLGRVRDRRLDGNVHASTPGSAKSIYSQGWHELEDNRSMKKHQHAVEQMQDFHRPSGEDISVDGAVV